MERSQGVVDEPRPDTWIALEEVPRAVLLVRLDQSLFERRNSLEFLLPQIVQKAVLEAPAGGKPHGEHRDGAREPEYHQELDCQTNAHGILGLDD